MTFRDPVLQRLLDGVEAAIVAAPDKSQAAVAAADRIFGALRKPAAAGVQRRPGRLPVCRYLDEAFDLARMATPPIAELADAFAAFEPRLEWTRRKDADEFGPRFAEGHANALVVGPGGYEPRQDVWVGVSLMAPRITYVDHDHPPEEIYVALSQGDWRQNQDPWRTPGPGGIVYNPPGIMHAMRSGAQPLLAVWCLWV